MRLGIMLAVAIALAGCSGATPTVTQSTPAFVEVGAHWGVPSSELVAVAQSHCKAYSANARQGAIREAMFGILGGRVVSYNCVR